MPLLDIRNLSIDVETPQGKIKIIDNINFTIEADEICGLVGESGSGKSTLFKVICSSIRENWRISADRFRFNDIELLKLPENQRRKLVGREISIIFQDAKSYLDPTKKISKQIIVNIPSWTFKGKWWQWFGWKKRRAIELLHRVGIKEHKNIMNSFAHEITEGEAQKIMIAIAVANQPRLLIADETINSLEPTTQLQVLRLLTSMNKNHGTAIILESNDLQSIAQWVDSFAIFYCGQNVENGSKEDILTTPHHPYTASLLNELPNFGQSDEFKTTLTALPGSIPLATQLPIGCRLGPRCEFAQKECTIKPSLRRIKNHQFACYYPLNMPKNNPAAKQKTELVI